MCTVELNGLSPSPFAVLVTVINSWSVKTTARVVTALSASKIVAVVFVALIGITFMLGKEMYPVAFQHPFQMTEGHVTTPATIALAMYGVLWSYDGWYVVGYFMNCNYCNCIPL